MATFLGRIILATGAALLITGCNTVPLDRDLAYREVPRSERTGTLDLKLEVKVVSEDGAPLPGIDVTASSRQSSDSDVTNSVGTATIIATVGEDEPIEFHFKSTRLGIDSTRPMLSYPRTDSTIRMLFKASSRGDIRLAEMEY